MTAPTVTTSWDDGHRLDARLADLLNGYDIPGTFYIAPYNVEIQPRDRLASTDVAELAHSFEIGGHTLNHLPLDGLSDERARDEIQLGKRELEDVVGGPVTSFCYPLGRYGRREVRLVAEAGFSLARTVNRSSLATGDPMEMSTTVNAYQHLLDGPLALQLGHGNPLRAARYYFNWDELAMRWFDLCLASGGVFHLWGHSWEVDARGDWARLERVLAHISRIPGVRYVTNGELAAAR
jgi:peptidoglycan/xylan/chitin deacetylase (PgdA/CDA1 family)